MIRALNPIVKRCVKQFCSSARFTHWLPTRMSLSGTEFISRRSRYLSLAPLAERVIHLKRHSSTTSDLESKKISKPVVVRELGIEESMFADCKDHKFTTLLSLKSKREIGLQQIRSCVERLQRRYINLRLALVEEDGKKYFAEIPDAPDFKVVQTSDVATAIQEELSTFFNRGELLWRIRLIQPEATNTSGYQYPFVFYFCHSGFDAVSVMNIFQTFMDDLEQATGADTSLDLEAGLEDSGTESQQLLPSREYVVYNERDKALATECSVIGSSSETPVTDLHQLALTLKDLHKPEHPQPVFGAEIFALNPEKNAQLRKAAKQHRVKMNSVFTSAVAVALVEFLTEHGVLETDVRIQLPYVSDLKCFADPPIPNTQVNLPGNYCCISFADVHVTKALIEAASNAALWDLIQSVDSEMQTSIKRRQPVAEAIKMDTMINAGEVPQGSMDPNSNQPMLILSSYLGNVNLTPLGKDDPAVTVENFYFALAPNYTTYFISAAIVNGVLRVFLSYDKRFTPEKLAKSFVSSVEQQLEKLISDN